MDRIDLPEIVPIFPLSGVLLLPGGRLPLNVFEPRYLAMVDAALRADRVIGMIQPRAPEECSMGLYHTGCAGRITSFEETGDGRYLITLTGVARFKIAAEIEQQNGYRRVRADWVSYPKDTETSDCLGIDRERLHALLENYFSQEGLSCNWDTVADTSDNNLITCLAMVCPFDAREKQALLEAPCCKERASLFMTLLEMAVKGSCAGRH
jgi:Lon protease-like protein